MVASFRIMRTRLSLLASLLVQHTAFDSACTAVVPHLASGTRASNVTRAAMSPARPVSSRAAYRR